MRQWQITVGLAAKLYMRLVRYCDKNGVSRSEAIRHLLTIGLDTEDRIK